MEESVVNGALGARFKAGLLNGLGKLSPTKSVEKVSMATVASPSSKNLVKGEDSVLEIGNILEKDVCNGDSLLDDDNNDDDLLLNENDDVLLEGDSPDQFLDEPVSKKPRTNGVLFTVVSSNAPKNIENKTDNELTNKSDLDSRLAESSENNKNIRKTNLAEVMSQVLEQNTSLDDSKSDRIQAEISKTKNTSKDISGSEPAQQSSAINEDSRDESLKNIDKNNSDNDKDEKPATNLELSSKPDLETNTNSPEATEVDLYSLGDEDSMEVSSNSIEVVHKDLSLHSSTESEVQETLDQLLEHTVLNTDISGVSCKPSLSRSGSNDEVMSLRSKLSPTEEEHDGRLNKLISHLSTTLDGKSSEAPSPDEMDDDLECFQLKKNGLASFYDAIIKSDVIKDSYHEELTHKHQELQIKNNMDCKKIQKILHEVKTVREKLKCMNIRPAQRCVGTQICSEKLQVPIDQQGNKILRSTVLSQKALTEQPKVEGSKLKPEPQIKRQLPEQNGKLKDVDLAVKRQLEEHARSLGARVREETKNTAETVSKPTPVKDSEVIDLTADDDSAKEAVTTLQDKSLNMFKPGASAVPRALHPAPLPAIPLTGTSGHLLKPMAPRLELSCKDDGIVLQWTMNLSKGHAKIMTYQIFGYKEKQGPLTGNEWKKVGDLKALPLPMACTLTQFQTGHRYHFAVRAVDELGRTGPFGPPRSTKLG